MKKFVEGRAPLLDAVASLILALSFVQAGCKAAPDSNAGESAYRKPQAGKTFELTINGYNYTNRYIDSYSVNGNGGGNLSVSGPGSSGGGSLCCVSYLQGRQNIAVRVRWQSGGCIYQLRSTLSSEIYTRIHSFYKEVEVRVSPIIPPNPKYFEVHFYPDGHVEAAITEKTSGPRLNFTEDREDKRAFARCQDDKKPEE